MLLSTLSAVACAADQKQIARVDWAAHAKREPLRHGTLVQKSVSVRTSHSLLVENDSAEVQRYSWTLLEQPRLKAGIYSQLFRFRSDIPEGNGHFEITLCGPPGGVLNFTTSPPLKTGELPWRDAHLQFEWTEDMGELSYVILELQLPPNSRVWIEPVTVLYHQRGDSNYRMRLIYSWWLTKHSPWVIGGLAAFFVLSCGSAWMLSRVNKARRFCLLSSSAALFAAIICLIMADVAYWFRQPAVVAWYLLLVAVPAFVVSLIVMLSVRKRFAFLQLRQEAAKRIADKLPS